MKCGGIYLMQKGINVHGLAYVYLGKELGTNKFVYLMANCRNMNLSVYDDWVRIVETCPSSLVPIEFTKQQIFAADFLYIKDIVEESKLSAWVSQLKLAGRLQYGLPSRLYIGDERKRKKLSCVPPDKIVQYGKYIQEELAYAVQSNHVLRKTDIMWKYMQRGLDGKYIWQSHEVGVDVLTDYTITRHQVSKQFKNMVLLDDSYTVDMED